MYPNSGDQPRLPFLPYQGMTLSRMVVVMKGWLEKGPRGAEHLSGCKETFQGKARMAFS